MWDMQASGKRGKAGIGRRRRQRRATGSGSTIIPKHNKTRASVLDTLELLRKAVVEQ
ncbi:hypothetical protein FB645_001630 [Coemansia sp. IMI 203386]|nr:hypothetical protein FB645_001630 [Coemansia sp. IMI 203386]